MDKYSLLDVVSFYLEKPNRVTKNLKEEPIALMNAMQTKCQIQSKHEKNNKNSNIMIH